MKKLFIAGSMALILLFSSACGSQSSNTSKAETTPLKENKNTIEAFGIVKSTEVKNITVDFQAGIEKVHVKEGQKVKNGDLLVTLNHKDYDSQIKDRESELKVLKDLGSSTLSQKEKIASLERNINLLKEKTSKSYLKGSTIISDLSNGLVYDIGVEPGDIASPARKVLSLMNLDKLVIEANIPEEFIKDVKTGAEVVFRPLADKSKEYKGKIMYIADKAQQKNGETNVPVQISIDNQDSFLLPDYNVDVEIKMADK